MNRKNTILIAVLINAGLLSVLLIAALTTQDEVSAPAVIGDDSSHFSKLEDPPLFGDSMDLAMRKSAEPSPIAIPLPELIKTETAPLAAQLTIPPAAAQISSNPSSNPAKEEPIVHKLPSLVPEVNPSLSPPAPVAPAATASRVASVHEVEVKKGDSLEKIAKKYATTVDEIIKMNQLPSSFLRIGQVLKIPSDRNLAASGGLASSPSKTKPAAAEAKASDAAAPEYYTVKVGDNPWTIAMKHHLKVEELLRLNALNEEKARKLKPGDRLRTR